MGEMPDTSHVFDAGASIGSHEDGYDSLMYWSALEEYYDHSDFVNYGYWDETTADARQACERLVDKLLAFIPEKRGRILDVGCGKGATTRHLLNHFPPEATVGINISHKQLVRCRQNAAGVCFVPMDAARLGFADNSFDAMISVEAAFHFVTREAFFREACRVLKPGGSLVLSDLLMSAEAEAKRRLGTPANYVETLADYEAVARRTGFRAVTVIDATGPCLKATFDHLVQFSHERLLDRRINAEQLKAFTQRFFGFVPHFRAYLIACLTR